VLTAVPAPQGQEVKDKQENSIVVRVIVHTSDSQQAGRSGDRIPLEIRFSASVPTRPLVNLVPGFFSGVEPSGCGFVHTPTSSVEVKERVDLYRYTPLPPGLHGLF
jgi:hypothetical protein